MQTEFSSLHYYNYDYYYYCGYCRSCYYDLKTFSVVTWSQICWRGTLHSNNVGELNILDIQRADLTQWSWKLSLCNNIIRLLSEGSQSGYSTHNFIQHKTTRWKNSIKQYRSACTRMVSENSCRLTNAFRTFILKSFLRQHKHTRTPPVCIQLSIIYHMCINVSHKCKQLVAKKTLLSESEWETVYRQYY